MNEWDVAQCGGVCAATGAPLAEGQEVYAVLLEEGETLRRVDYSLDGWSGPPAGAFCFYKTRVPVKERKKRLLVDDEVLINFFLRLADETQEARVHFRFVLALILMRKRLLKYEDTERNGDREFWRMRFVRDTVVHRVENPRLTEEQISAVSRELGAILHGDMGEFDDFARDDESDGPSPEETDTHA
jgi:hypothetical protein